MGRAIYKVLRQHDGDRQYWQGDEREMDEADAIQLVRLGTIAKLRDINAAAVLENKMAPPMLNKSGSLLAKHRGGGSYSVMCGDDPVELAESLSRDEAEAFNALDDIGRAAFVAAHAKLPG